MLQRGLCMHPGAGEVGLMLLGVSLGEKCVCIVRMVRKLGCQVHY